MLTIGLQKLVNTIIEITNSHRRNPSDENMVARDWEFLFRDYEGWSVISVESIASNGYGRLWIHPTLCPEARIDEIKSRLPNSISQPSPGAYDHVSGSGGHRIEPAWNDSDLADGSAQIFFNRNYYGRPPGKENYIEFNQLVTHPLGLHWSESKQALCMLDRSGDEIEKLKVVTEAKIQLVLIRRKTLDKLLYLGNWQLVRSINFSRWLNECPPFDKCKTQTVEAVNYNGKFEIRTCGTDSIEWSETIGTQFEKPVHPIESVLPNSWGLQDEAEEEERKYGKFIVQDWKNGLLRKEYSIEPSNFANYFTESEKPFEVSPIFFKAEVLDKYKHNPDKYDLSERSISCRGGWSLQTYDINEHNQVHTYAIYLSRLPYKEQLYWQHFNEEPKGTISRQSYRTDFEAKWPDERSKMGELRSALELLGKTNVSSLGPVWSPKGGNWNAAAKGFYTVHTENSNQWHDFIMALANTTTEGLDTKVLLKIAERFGNTDTKLRTLGLLKFILTASGNEQLIPSTHGVLNELRLLRGEGKAHGSWKTPEGSLIEDSRSRLVAVTKAIQSVTEFFRTLSVP